MEKELENHPLVLALKNRLGDHRVKVMPNPLHAEQALLFLFLEKRVPVTIVSTIGLSDYKMPVLEKWIGREHNEIYFCLPAFWDIEDMTNQNFSWPFDWIYRLENFVREKNTWFGPGHTIPAGNPVLPISETVQQEYFMLYDPIFVADELAPFQMQNNSIQFLCIFPIHGDELDYKMGKGTYKFIKLFVGRGHDERIDYARKSVKESRFKIF